MITVCIPTMKPNVDDIVKRISETATNTIKIVASCQKQSAAANRNFCLNKVKSGIVIMVDDDIYGYYKGWDADLVTPLKDKNILMVSARLIDVNGNVGSIYGSIDDKTMPIVDAPGNIVPSAAIAFRKSNLLYDEDYMGSGYEDTDYCNQLMEKSANGRIVINNTCRLSHKNEAKNQGGVNMAHNQKLYKGKWVGGKRNIKRSSKYKRSVGFFYTLGGNITGCWKVAHNTVMGLAHMGVDVKQNRLGDMNGCVHATTRFNERTLPFKTLIGPEIMVLPDEMIEPWKVWKDWTQPCQWVKDYMETFPTIKNNNLHLWPAGIDTHRFYPNSVKIKYDCFIYYKNVTKQTPRRDLVKVKKELDRRKMKYKVLEYGKYSENQLLKRTSDCSFGIWLVGSESQNIALMEVLSCGVPLYVMDCKKFKYKDFTFSKGVTSAPYFTEACGIKVKGLDFSRLDYFMDHIDDYDPRSYIMDEHTLIKGAEKYYKILEKVNDKK